MSVIAHLPLKDSVLALLGALFVLGAASVILVSLKAGITPMPSSPAAAGAVIGLLSRYFTAGDSRVRSDTPATRTAAPGTVIDAGSGWGTLVFAAAKAFPDRLVVGYEISPVPFLFSRIRLLFSKTPNVRFVRADFLSADFAGAAAVVCYLHPDGMERLRSALESLDSPPAVVSSTFALPGYPPSEVFRLQDIHRTPVYLYLISAR